MTPSTKRSCELTKRLAEDMKIRHAAQATIDAYTFHARRFADFMEKPLDRATPEDVRRFQLHLIEERKLAQEQLQSGGLCPTVSVYTYDPCPLAGHHGPFRETCQEAARGAQPTRSRCAAVVHPQPQTSDVSLQPLRLRAETLRGGPFEDRGHRRGEMGIGTFHVAN